MPWLIAIAALLAYEAWALATKHRTLSRMMRNAQEAWPFFAPLVGFLVGVLLAHFFWIWC